MSMLSLSFDSGFQFRMPDGWHEALAACARLFGHRASRRPQRAEREPRADEGGPYVGWFDSSHDLVCGLAITEHAEPVETDDVGVRADAVRWWQECLATAGAEGICAAADPMALEWTPELDALNVQAA